MVTTDLVYTISEPRRESSSLEGPRLVNLTSKRLILDINTVYERHHQTYTSVHVSHNENLLHIHQVFTQRLAAPHTLTWKKKKKKH